MEKIFDEFLMEGEQILYDAKEGSMSLGVITQL
jgi:hypothetical protein